MSGHMRFGLAAFLVVAGFSTPAAANVITDLFSPTPAPEAATAAPAPSSDDCLRQPGPTAAGQHWVYRYDGHRKCWFQAAADSAMAKRAVRHHAARHSAAAPEEDEPAPRRQKAVEDARDEMVSSAPALTPQVAPSEPAPAETAQPTPSEPKLTIVHTIPIHMADAAAQVPPAPVAATSGADQSTSDQPTSYQSAPRQVDVDKLLADASADEVASRHPAAPLTAPAVETDGRGGWTTNWLGVLLMALGLAALLSASRTLRQALPAARFLISRTEFPVIAHGGRNDPSFGRSASHWRAPGEASFSAATRRVGPRTARARRPLAAELASREAC